MKRVLGRLNADLLKENTENLGWCLETLWAWQVSKLPTFKKNHVSSSSDPLSISYNTKPDHHSYFNVHTILKLGRTFNIENLKIIGIISKFVFFVITQCHLYNPDESLFCLCDPRPSWEGNLAWRYRLGRERGVEWIISQYIQKNTRQYILKYCPNIYSKVVSIEILPMYFPKYI